MSKKPLFSALLSCYSSRLENGRLLLNNYQTECEITLPLVHKLILGLNGETFPVQKFIFVIDLNSFESYIEGKDLIVKGSNKFYERIKLNSIQLCPKDEYVYL